MADQTFAINTPLINYFFAKSADPTSGANIPLAGGYLFFYADEDHNLKLPTYSDVSDPDNPTVNPNPLQLSATGSCPIFYLLDRLYYIVITDSTQDQNNPITTIEHYNPLIGGSGGIGNSPLANLLANGQFTYPVTFWQNDQEEGEIVDAETIVALGWEFQSDAPAGSCFVTINDVSNDFIEGSPINEIQLISSGTLGETVKDFVAKYGSVTAFENEELTFSVQLQSKSFSSVSIPIIIEKNYGDGGSPATFTVVDTFLALTDRDKFVTTFAVPSDAGKTIGSGNYSAIHIQAPLSQAASFGMTNALLQFGEVTIPVYISEDFANDRAQSIGAATQLEPIGLDQNYSPMYYANGEFFPYADTGTMIIAPANSPQSFRLPIVTPATVLKVSEYTNGIPNQRLFDEIGDRYGTAGDLIVTSQSNVVSFTIGAGGREFSAYDPGTTNFTVANTLLGQRAGLSLAYSAPGSRTLVATWLDTFVINTTAGRVDVSPGVGFPATPNGVIGNRYQMTNQPAPPFAPIGSRAITTATVNNNGVTPPVANITFTTTNIDNYRVGIAGFDFGAGRDKWYATNNFLEFAAFGLPTRGTYSGVNNARHASYFSAIGIRITVNGTSGDNSTFIGGGSLYTITVPFMRDVSIDENIKTFIRTVDNPFIWQVTVTSAPAASDYFLVSSTSDEYTPWYQVDGVGTDPMLPGRDSVMIAISSGDSIEAIATKTAAALNTLTFSLPVPANLPTLPDALSQWYINQ